MRVVATGDKACAPSSSTLRNEFFKDVNNDIPKENKEENARNYVHFDGNDKKGKHLRLQLHILKLEGRNPQSKLEGLQDCPVK
ncbi:hypothetical protein Gotri_004464 [Gossypium trilobum]|uniref:Uncharacterized protein n=1 Tax=Gossypium trilobum TaxID=34281 RepID=A0A7J9F4Y1_9ROSI|nr:hypothetical protein [Gossypium trilobum]